MAVLITGPSKGGIGALTAVNLAQAHPARLILAGRTLSKIQPVIDEIKQIDADIRVEFVSMDLASQASIREGVAEVSKLTDTIDVVINNAGLMAIKDFTTTKEGIEMQFGANHIGHFLLTNLLMPLLLNAAKANPKDATRVLSLSSNGYMTAGFRGSDYNFDNGKAYNPWLAYGQSKTANLLFTLSLAEKLKEKGIAAFAVMPGLVLESNLQDQIPSELFQDGIEQSRKAFEGREAPPMDPPKEKKCSTSTTVVAALDPDMGSDSGAYLQDCQVVPQDKMEAHGKDAAAAKELWALSEKLVGQKFDW